MAKTPNARPTAEGVDPIEQRDPPAPAPAPEPAADPAPVTVPDDPKPKDETVEAPFAPGTDPSVAEKISVKTTGDFNLMDPWTGTHIRADSEGTELVKTQWVADQLEAKRLELA